MESRSPSRSVTFEGELPVRLDVFLTETIPGLSSRSLLKRSGLQFMVNKKPAKPSHRLKPGDVVEVDVEACSAPDVPHVADADTLGIRTLYEDEFLWVVNKPTGLASHGASIHGERNKPTVHSALVGREGYSFEPKNNLREGVVHRLDKDTSGLMVLAKTREASEHLKRQFSERRVRKVYLALVEGRVFEAVEPICYGVARHPKNPLKRIASSEGKKAITHYEVVRYYESTTLLRLRPLTGRTHQIRVHMLAIKSPVVGDSLYGKKPSSTSKNLHLVATKLDFKHPTTNKQLSFSVGLPGFFAATLKAQTPLERCGS